MTFPADFLWGAATSAYQIEGAADEDSKGSSIWDRFGHEPGKIYNDENGDVACDHYHRWQDDIALMGQIGLRAYRFSVSWPRILPEGTGAVNARGLDFYDRLVDGLLAAGIAPFLTLFHWDLPDALHCRGGWLNRNSADWFAEYAGVVADRLSDRVSHWLTFNEPTVFMTLGYVVGSHAPGVRTALPDVLQASHHVLLAHGQAVQAIRARVRRPVRIGLPADGGVFLPASDSAADVEAACQMTFGIIEPTTWATTWWRDPMVFGTYPENGLRVFRAVLPTIREGDMATIRQPLDFLAANLYSARSVRAVPTDPGGYSQLVPIPPGFPPTLAEFGWYLTPDTLYWGPKLLWERYRLPIVITENGLANADWPSLDGHVHDPQRIDFTRRYLLALERAIGEGVPVHGYFHWSLMDNLEWHCGTRYRFGLIHVDYRTQQRVLKDSAYWYRDVIASDGMSLKMDHTGAQCRES